MKKIILGSVSAAALLMAGVAFAEGNASTIAQIGTSQNAAVDQTQSSGGSVAQITQGLADGDANNQASVTQGASNNQASVTQSQSGFGVASPSNTATVDQQGAGGSALVLQVGNNAANVQQLSGAIGETAEVSQSNNFNSATVVQQGTNEFGLVNQEAGTGNVASITQTGTGSGPVTPIDQNASLPTPGPGSNLFRGENVPNDSGLPGAANSITTYGPTGAYVDQGGANNQGTVSQAGVNNFADVAQGQPGDATGNIGTVTQGMGLTNTDGVMYQQGNGNIASINQSGDGSSYSTVWQNGNGNQASSTQVGSENSVIAQGQQNVGKEPGSIPTPADTPANSDFASVDQRGGNDTSLVNQTGSNDQAFVSQQNAGATSTVTQGGSFNVANVHQ